MKPEWGSERLSRVFKLLGHCDWAGPGRAQLRPGLAPVAPGPLTGLRPAEPRDVTRARSGLAASAACPGRARSTGPRRPGPGLHCGKDRRRRPRPPLAVGPSRRAEHARLTAGRGGASESEGRQPSAGVDYDSIAAGAGPSDSPAAKLLPSHAAAAGSSAESRRCPGRAIPRIFRSRPPGLDYYPALTAPGSRGDQPSCQTDHKCRFLGRACHWGQPVSMSSGTVTSSCNSDVTHVLVTNLPGSAGAASVSVLGPASKQQREWESKRVSRSNIPANRNPSKQECSKRPTAGEWNLLESPGLVRPVMPAPMQVTCAQR